MEKIYIKEKKDLKLLDPFLVHMVLGTLIGARLGEVFFYNWGYFQNNLLEIFLPIKIDENGWNFVGYMAPLRKFSNLSFLNVFG